MRKKKLFVEDGKLVRKVKSPRKLLKEYGIKEKKFFFRPLCFLNLWVCLQCGRLYFTLDLESLTFDAGLGLCWNCDEEYHHRKLDEFL